MRNVDLSTAELVNNPEMRRLELLYVKSSVRYELHFYYGRMKQDADGNGVPLILGPHKMGVRCKHYNLVSGAWTGWSGDSTATGDVYAERVRTVDAANGYDSSGSIPFSVETGESYVGQFGRAVLLGFGYPKFSDTTSPRTLTDGLTGTFRRDGSSSAQTKTKDYGLGTQKKVRS